jgi:hypothetical protein
VADFVLREWNLAPNPGDQAPPHIHHQSDEAFIVLGGQLEVLMGDERRVLHSGSDEPRADIWAHYHACLANPV